ncbi:30S ribosomal protein S9 [Patescibacteria group bacterium]|jgi:small subunit ribosomal protein S9|nr:30S ribosomal protein S9 [Patescibacteria group bacterium]
MATKSATPYIEAVGRRKTATARVRITPSKETTVVVNEKSLQDYFGLLNLSHVVLSVFKVEDTIGNYTVTARVSGGGLSSQAESIRLGIARALVKETPDRRKPLKKEGYLKRDPRSKERKKFGLRKARRRPQWSKR